MARVSKEYKKKLLENTRRYRVALKIIRAVSKHNRAASKVKRAGRANAVNPGLNSTSTSPKPIPNILDIPDIPNVPNLQETPDTETETYLVNHTRVQLPPLTPIPTIPTTPTTPTTLTTSTKMSEQNETAAWPKADPALSQVGTLTLALLLNIRRIKTLCP